MFLIDYLTTLIKISETWGITASQYVCTLACLWGNHTAAAAGNGQGHFPAPPFGHSLCLCCSSDDGCIPTHTESSWINSFILPQCHPTQCWRRLDELFATQSPQKLPAIGTDKSTVSLPQLGPSVVVLLPLRSSIDTAATTFI